MPEIAPLIGLIKVLYDIYQLNAIYQVLAVVIQNKCKLKNNGGLFSKMSKKVLDEVMSKQSIQNERKNNVGSNIAESKRF